MQLKKRQGLPEYECCLDRPQGSRAHGQPRLHPHAAVQGADVQIQCSYDLENSTGFKVGFSINH